MLFLIGKDIELQILRPYTKLGTLYFEPFRSNQVKIKWRELLCRMSLSWVLSCWMSQGQKWLTKFVNWPNHGKSVYTGTTKGGSIIVPMTSCLTGLESAVWQLPIFVFICKTDYSKSFKQEVNHTVILPPLVFPGVYNVCDARIPDKLIRINQRMWSFIISNIRTDQSVNKRFK